jgi:hypothetical protein
MAGGDGGSGRSKAADRRQLSRGVETHGAAQLGALRVTELPTSRANAYLQSMGSTTQAKRLRMILSGMCGLAVRYDVLFVNPIREARTVKTTEKATRAATRTEFEQVRTAVTASAEREGRDHGLVDYCPPLSIFWRPQARS